MSTSVFLPLLAKSEHNVDRMKARLQHILKGQQFRFMKEDLSELCSFRDLEIDLWFLEFFWLIQFFSCGLTLDIPCGSVVEVVLSILRLDVTHALCLFRSYLF